MESSRGCWWGEKQHCTFCGLNGTSMAFRSKSAARVLEEITELQSRYRCDYIAAVDNILDMKYFRDLVPELGRRRLDIRLFYEAKANLTKQQIQTMQAAGITAFQPGIESLSSEVLRLMRKGTTAIQNIQLLKWSKEAGIKVFWNLLYGFPDESPADYDTMASIMDNLHHLAPPQGISPLRLDRFSPHFVASDRFGIVDVRPDRNYGFIYDLPREDLFNLAYFFEHDFRDGRDPETYVGNARRALNRWHEGSDNPGLNYVDHGDDLAIWDRRPKAKRTVTILTGEERSIYLYCDQRRTMGQIKTWLRETGQERMPLLPFLDRLIADRLMIHLDGCYLSLATMTAAAPRSTPARTDVLVTA
jgi:ribosomal peptide maturation radical SAM protein 1